MFGRRAIAGILTMCSMLFATSYVAAQSYPTKAIRLVTNAAGGDGDFASRIIAQGMSESMGQQVIVDNRGGIVPTMVIMVKAPPDGYTMLVSGSGVYLYPLLQKSSFFDMEKDAIPVSQITREVYILVMNPAVPANSVKDLIAYAKANPGKLNYSTSGTGGPSHIGAELLNSMAGVKLTRVAYKGTPAAVVGVVSGEVQITFSNPELVMGNVKAGKLKALAITSRDPSVLAPGLPTLAASGVPGYELAGATGAFVPAKTPVAIITRLNREIVRVMSQPDVKEKFLNSGSEPVGNTAQEYDSKIKADIAKTRQLIKDGAIEVNP